MNNNFSFKEQEVLNSITAEQWEAIAAYAMKMAAGKGASEEKREPVKRPLSANELYTEVTKMLHNMGVPAHIKGYHYVREAILMSYQDWNYVEQVTKVLYPTIAKKYSTTTSRVEKAIRHAVECAFDRGDLNYFDLYNITYSSGRGKPTNSEFIAAVADYLKQREQI